MTAPSYYGRPRVMFASSRACSTEKGLAPLTIEEMNAIIRRRGAGRA
jgi:hypothetical protein